MNPDELVQKAQSAGVSKDEILRLLDAGDLAGLVKVTHQAEEAARGHGLGEQQQRRPIGIGGMIFGPGIKPEPAKE